MHLFRGKSCGINHNSDLSGKVIVTVPQEHGFGSVTVEIDGQDLLNFVAEHVRMSKISALETASTAELLGLE